MTVLTRYIIRELLKVFLISLTAMTIMMIMVFLIQEALREKLTPQTIIELVPYTVPTALCFSIPGTILFSVCVVYARLAANREWLAVRAMGIPPSRLILPGLLLAFCLSLTTVYLNDVSATWGRRGIYRVVLNSASQTIYSVLRTHGSFQKGKVSIIVDGVQGDRLINPLIEQQGESPADRTSIHAVSARISVDSDRSALVFHLRGGRLEAGDEIRAVLDSDDIPIPLQHVTKKSSTETSPSNFSLRELPIERISQTLRTESLRREMAIDAAASLLGGDMVSLLQPRWQLRLYELERSLARENRIDTEAWRRWANGFSCLCFAMVGMPLALRMQKSDFWTIFGICFIPILLVYYPLMMFGLDLAKSGALPPIMVWTGNCVMAVIGGLMLRHVLRR